MAQRDGQRRKKLKSSRYDNGCQVAQRHSSWTMSCCPFLLMLWRLEQTRDVIQATGDGAGRYPADSACSKSCKGPRKEQYRPMTVFLQWHTCIEDFYNIFRYKSPS